MAYNEDFWTTNITDCLMAVTDINYKTKITVFVNKIVILLFHSWIYKTRMKMSIDIQKFRTWGNRYFSNGCFSEAIQCYEKGMFAIKTLEYMHLCGVWIHVCACACMFVCVRCHLMISNI